MKKMKFEAIALNLQQGLIRANLPGTVVNGIVAIWSHHKDVIVIRPEWRDEQEAICAACPLIEYSVIFGDSFHVDTWDEKIKNH